LDLTGRVREDRHTADLGDDLLEELQLFAGYFRADAVGQPCDVPARARQARDEPEPNRIGTTGNHDDGDRLGGVLGCRHSLRRRGYDDVHLEPDQLGRESGEPIGLPLGISVFDHDVATLDVTEVPQSLTEGLGHVRGSSQVDHRQEAYSRDLGRLLRFGGERRGEASSFGSELWVFTRQRNSSWSRSITFAVRRVFHCALGM
jgi:hypothetical protein